MFFCSSGIPLIPIALRNHDSPAFVDSKVTTLEKSVAVIQQTESKLCEMVKSVEVQLKHQKALTSLINDHKAAQNSSFSTPSPTSPITIESVASIAASITAGQKRREKRQLNVIVHNVEEPTASEGLSRKEDDINKCKSMFQTYLGATVSIQNAIRLGKRSEKSRLL